MKKIIFTALAVFFVIAAFSCASNPNVGPEIAVVIPELFSPDPDVDDDKMSINISVKHPVNIKDWTITIQPQLQRQAAGGQATPRAVGEEGPARQQRQSAAEAGQQRQRQASDAADGDGQPRQRRVRAPFYEEKKEGRVPAVWQWNGKGNNGEMVQSAMDYRFTLSVNDIYDNNTVYESTIPIDIIVRRDGDDYRMVVADIIFPPSDYRLDRVSEDEQRSNRRVLNLVGRALNRFPDYSITVEGHANPTTEPGTPARAAEDREAISGQRAQAVVDYLVANANIDRAKLKSVGLGGTRTVADWDDDEENWKNRRVEFILHKN